MKDDAVIIEPSAEHEFSLIWLHGLGADGHDFVPIVPQLKIASATNTRFIFPHAPRQAVTINGGMKMRSWFDIIALNESAQIDLQGILDSRSRINSLIEGEIERGLSSEKIIICGFSQGGTMALISGLGFPQRLGGVIALSTFLPEKGIELLDNNATNKPTKIFMAHGTHDGLLPLAYGQHSCEQLQSHGYTVQWHEYAMDHSVCLQEISDISHYLRGVGM